MIKKYLILLIYIAFISHKSFCQNINCDEIRSQKIPEISENDRSAVSETLRIINYCLKLDSTDSIIFNEVSLSTLIAGISNQTTPVTYGSIMDMIQNIRQSEFYDKTKANVEFYNEYAGKTISKKDSLAIHKGFQSLHEGINTDSLIAFIYNRDNKSLTYKQAYLNYLNILNGIEEEKFKKEYEDFNSIFQDFEYYEKALNDSKKARKSFILYFTGHTDLNGRKFESTSLRNPEILDIIKKKYRFYSLFVDETSKIDDKVKEKIMPLSFTNKGKYYQYLQNTLINNTYQTTLIIVNISGKVVFQKRVSQLSEKELLNKLRTFQDN